MSDTVISVEDISKQYRLGSIGSGTLYRDLQSWWAKFRSKEDPNSILCEHDQSQVNGNVFWALRGVSFEVKQGDVVGIIGRNGAGKSTLLKIMSRITEPTSGCVKIRGRVASLLEVGTGFHPELTGRENVYLNGAILGMRQKEIDKKFDEIVEFAEIAKFIDTPVKRYSSGMYVRLAFSVAAHLEPEILVVDEVLAVGDLAFQKKCLGKMQDVSVNEGRTVLFVSHNMTAVKNLCHYGVLLEKGQVDLKGPIDDVLQRYLQVSQDEMVCYREFAPKPGKRVQFLAACLIDGDNQIVNKVIDFSTKLTVKFTLKLSEKVKNLYVVYSVFNAMDEPVMLSDVRDHYQEYLSLEAGEYEFEAEFPNPLLVPGLYKIMLKAMDMDRNQEQKDLIHNCLVFEIRDISSCRGVERPGQVFVCNKWSYTAVK